MAPDIDAFDAGLVEAAPAPLKQVLTTSLSPAASTTLAAPTDHTLFASRGFFARAAEELLVSTQATQELAGACFAKMHKGRVVLVGLRRETAGTPGRVPIRPEWGSILWHTHPGLRGSLAAFSNEDIDVAAKSGKPLLVIGFGGLSIDVVTTLTMPFGLRAFLVSAGVKGLLSLEKAKKLEPRLLQLGVAARVVFPSGQIRIVRRYKPTPWEAALEDMSFAVDRGVGAVERAGQRLVKSAIARITGE
jgi:hypothetical protein